MSDYGMYSHDGELEIGLIVAAAKQFNWNWHRVQTELETLAGNPDYSEAFDTVVRECVYKALKLETPFYT